MNSLEIASIKDNILQYLSKRHQKRESLEAAYLDLKLTIPIDVVKGITEEMVKDGAIQTRPFSSDRTVLFLKPMGEKIMFDGGYTSLAEKELVRIRQDEEDQRNERTKTQLEIDNLKISKPLSIAAFIISIISIILSIIFYILN